MPRGTVRDVARAGPVPELVDREAMASLEYVAVSLPKVIAAGLKDFRDMGLDRAYCGAPAEATAAERGVL